MDGYYSFRQQSSRVEESIMLRIGQLSASGIRAAWAIHFRYLLLRFGGMTQEEIKAAGNFLNYGITWDFAERVYGTLSQDPSVAISVTELFQAHTKLCDGVAALAEHSRTATE
jgi:hypothetical protein